jgi:hypothetical protein
MKIEIDIGLSDLPHELYAEVVNDFISEDLSVVIDGNDIVIFSLLDDIDEKIISFDKALRLIIVDKSGFHSDNVDAANRAIFTAQCLRNYANKLDDYVKSLDV